MRLLIIIFCSLCFQSSAQLDSLRPEPEEVRITPVPVEFFEDKDYQDRSIVRKSSIALGADSLHVYKDKRGYAYFSIQGDATVQTAWLHIPSCLTRAYGVDPKDVSYAFKWDSLNTSEPHLLVYWSWHERQVDSRNYGSDEFCGSQTVTEYYTQFFGLTIINPIERQILFQDLTEIRKEITQKKYPGGREKTLEDSHVNLVRFHPSSGAISLMLEPSDHDYLCHPKRYVYGAYLLEQEGFTLKKKY